MYCSSCGAQVSSNGRFCSTCGGALDLNAAPTIDSNDLSAEQETIAPPAPSATPRKPSSAPTPTRPSRSPSSGGPGVRLTSSDPIGGGRFTPGQIIAERYRVVAMAGRGGMGEVYRAEDMKLGQVVAIKFLPEASRKMTPLSRDFTPKFASRAKSPIPTFVVSSISATPAAPPISPWNMSTGRTRLRSSPHRKAFAGQSHRNRPPDLRRPRRRP